MIGEEKRKKLAASFGKLTTTHMSIKNRFISTTVMPDFNKPTTDAEIFYITNLIHHNATGHPAIRTLAAI
jgi:hypothetical protein